MYRERNTTEYIAMQIRHHIFNYKYLKVQFVSSLLTIDIIVDSKNISFNILTY